MDPTTKTYIRDTVIAVILFLLFVALELDHPPFVCLMGELNGGTTQKAQLPGKPFILPLCFGGAFDQHAEQPVAIRQPGRWYAVDAADILEQGKRRETWVSADRAY